MLRERSTASCCETAAPQQRLQLGDGALGIAQVLQDGDTRGMRQRLEELGLEALQRLRHAAPSPKLRIIAASHLRMP